MKNILNWIAEFYSQQHYLVRIILFAVMTLPFIGLGALLRQVFVINAGLDEMNIVNTFIYTLPPLALFVLFIFGLFKQR